MLTGPCLNAAARNDWHTVFTLLSMEGAVNFQARHDKHPRGFRLFDYAEREGKAELIIQLWKLGLRPSYDIKLFTAAEEERWNDVYRLLLTGVAHVNWQNEMHPQRWTLVDYASAQNKFEIINNLLIHWHAKCAETLQSMSQKQMLATNPQAMTPPTAGDDTFSHLTKATSSEAGLSHPSDYAKEKIASPNPKRGTFNPYYQTLIAKVQTDTSTDQNTDASFNPDSGPDNEVTSAISSQTSSIFRF